MSVQEFNIERATLKVWDFDLSGVKSIENRTEKCLCGCGGKDPWHVRFFKRRIRNVREVGTPNVIEDRRGRKFPVIALAEVSLPMSSQPVRIGLRFAHIGNTAVTLGWYVDHASIVYDR